MLGALAVAVGDLVAAGSRDAALVALDNAPSCSVTHLSRALGRSHSATVRLIDGLVADGLLERRSGDDRRSVAIVLTRAGIGAARAVRARRASVLDELVSTLGARQVERLAPILERLLEAAVTDAGAPVRICRLCDESLCESGHHCPVDAAASS